jgi:hypothetical protein
MTTEKQRREQARVYKQYRAKGFGKDRAAFIARAVVYGKPRRKPVKRHR